ncbi:hypothetical protein D9M69_650710 [compost metagenome]
MRDTSQRLERSPVASNEDLFAVVKHRSCDQALLFGSAGSTHDRAALDVDTPADRHVVLELRVAGVTHPQEVAKTSRAESQA